MTTRQEGTAHETLTDLRGLKLELLHPPLGNGALPKDCDGKLANLGPKS